MHHLTTTVTTPVIIAMLVVVSAVTCSHRGMRCKYDNEWPNNDVTSCVISSRRSLVRNYTISSNIYHPSTHSNTHLLPSLLYPPTNALPSTTLLFYDSVLHCCIADAPSNLTNTGSTSGASATSASSHSEGAAATATEKGQNDPI